LVFDVISFLAGVAAGALTWALAGVLHGLERTADLHERLRQVSKEVDRVRDALLSSTDSGPTEQDARVKVIELQRDLEAIHEEIRRMYKRTAR